jgi:hypothetical protein
MVGEGWESWRKARRVTEEDREEPGKALASPRYQSGIDQGGRRKLEEGSCWWEKQKIIARNGQSISKRLYTEPSERRLESNKEESSMGMSGALNRLTKVTSRRRSRA